MQKFFRLHRLGFAGLKQELHRVLRLLFRWLWREVWANFGILLGYGFVAILGLALTFFMLWPSYKDPASRMYTSGMGYGAMKRKMGLPFDVSGALAQRKQVMIPYLGEGLVNGAPTRLAIIPMAKITKVHVEEGDFVRKGQLLLELDDLEAQRKLASAKLMLSTAEAELSRVKIGSAYVLAQERPEHDQIKLDDAQKQLAILQKEMDTKQALVDRGLLAKSELYATSLKLQEAKKWLDECVFFAGVSEKGVPHSREIAENAKSDALAAVAYRESELKNYRIHAPADGIISAVLVREGEFNSDTGKPGFLLTQGMWFEGYFDQVVLSRIKMGQESEVYLEAFPGEMFRARVSKIIPEVTFASGGPEIARPMRPRGTGAPEWAATFRVRFELLEPASGQVRGTVGLSSVAIGMTGNVKVLTQSIATVVPRNAVLSVAAARALVTQPCSSELNEASSDWTMKPVKLGYVGHDWAEIAEGLNEGDVVLVKGHRIIREGDAIRMVELN